MTKRLIIQELLRFTEPDGDPMLVMKTDDGIIFVAVSFDSDALIALHYDVARDFASALAEFDFGNIPSADLAWLLQTQRDTILLREKEAQELIEMLSSARRVMNRLCVAWEVDNGGPLS